MSTPRIGALSTKAVEQHGAISATVPSILPRNVTLPVISAIRRGTRIMTVLILKVKKKGEDQARKLTRNQLEDPNHAHLPKTGNLHLIQRRKEKTRIPEHLPEKVIKILLHLLLRNETLSIQPRNQVLKKMTKKI